MKMSNILWGILLVIVGVIFGLNALGISDINIFFEGWWTLFLIIPGFIGLFTDRDKTGNFILLIIGVFLLLAVRDIIDFTLFWKLLFPIILVILGLSLIFKDSLKGKISKEIKKHNKDLKEYVATFGNQDLDFSKEKFEGCQLTSIFGGIKCDLSNSSIKEETIIKAEVIFGGIDIIVPDDVTVKVISTSIFGGVSNKKKKYEGKKVLYIEATCLFGGVEIK